MFESLRPDQKLQRKQPVEQSLAVFVFGLRKTGAKLPGDFGDIQNGRGLRESVAEILLASSISLPNSAAE
ncbi:hypothetical protein [Pseudomonas wenzhouensis]|uniref:hypothetical protein n=1 Tax=Pseudomonas wenzhouensis TaxID=2906062 RepID=UPI003B84613F